MRLSLCKNCSDWLSVYGSLLQRQNGALPLLRKQFNLTLNNRRNVNTWSPLAAAFNTNQTGGRLNFNIFQDVSGLFQIPELIDHSGFYVLEKQTENEVESLVEEVTSPDRKRKVVEIFDQLSDSLCRVADMTDFVRSSHPDKKFMEAANDTCGNLSGLVEKLNTNTDIHRVLKHIIENGDVVPTDELDKRLAELFMFDFEQSGIHLDADKRTKFVQLNDSALRYGHLFVQGTQKSIAIARDKLPANIQNSFGYQGDSILITGLYADHYNDLVREAAYKIYLYQDKDQEKILNSLLSIRHQIAEVVGFPTYAHRALKGTMAGSPENVMSFLETLADELKPRAQKDYDKLLKLKKTYGSTGNTILPWDPPYYSALGRNQQCNINSANLAPYFSLGCCMDGLNNLFKCLFDVTLQPVAAIRGEVWTPDVKKLAVVHATEGTLGYIYCDFFERPNKPIQDCHYTIQGGRLKEDGEYQYPIVVLQLNFSSPQGKVPTLLTPGQVENLFHEFGHAMHSMLGRTKYQHVTGTRCPSDFAEVPSVLMEFFVRDPRVLSSFARHYKTGEPIPAEMIKATCQAKTMFEASELQLQVFYSLLDQVYHGPHPLGKSTTDILAEVQAKYYSIPHVSGTAWQLRFGHLVTYGARYYSYLMSRAVASRIWHTCFKQDPFNRKMGERYRREMLAHGGGIPPLDLVDGLLNDRPTMDKLVESLIKDVDTYASEYNNNG